MTETPDHGRDRLGLMMLVGAIGALLLVGLTGTSVALPPLGDRGWAPPALPWQLGAWLVVLLQGTAYVLGAASLWRWLRRPVPLRLRWWHLALLAVLVLLTAPFGSADHTNYAAYGRILLEGGDPWSVVPLEWRDGTDPVVEKVQDPWREAPSVYGPVGTWLMGLAALLGGEVMRQVVWVWQLLVVAAWLGTRAVLVSLGTDREVVDRWWTTNVFVLGAGVLGAHLDTVAVAALALALALGLSGRPLLAGLLTGLAASTKLTAGVVGIALLWALIARDADHRPRWSPALQLVLGALVVLVPTHLAVGAGAVARIRDAGSGISYAMPWRALYTAVDLLTSEPLARTLTTWVAATGCLLLAMGLWRITEDLTHLLAVRVLFVLTTAYSLGAGYVLPWYELPQWLATAVLLGLLDREGLRRLAPLLTALVARSVVLALAYVPGRVHLPSDLETATLGVRFVASPVMTVGVWLLIWWLWRDRRRLDGSSAIRSRRSIRP